MKKFLIFGICFFASITYAQDFYEELKNSVKRTEGGSGAEVIYYIYMSSTQINTFYAKDYDKGTLIEEDGKPLYFELTKTKGEEKQVININLATVRYSELESGYRKGGYKYIYRFYY